MEQQGASGWYDGSQQQQYGGHSHPQSHPPMQWQVRPETTQHYNQPPQMHPSQQQHQYQQAYPTAGGYYGQPARYYPSQQQQVPQSSAPQPAVPPPLPQQHGMIYGQAEQAWPSSNGWSKQQWPSAEDSQPGNSTAGLSQEEEWAAKARAWAASKAAQNAQQYSQLHVHTQPDQSNLQQLPLPPPPPPPPPQPVDMSQQFAYQAHEAGTPAYGHDISHKYGQDSPGLFGRDTSSRMRGEESKSFAVEG